LYPSSPHDFIYKEDEYCVNEKKLRIDYQRFPNYIEKIQLNHYFCRSLSEIEEKLKRGRGAEASVWKRARFEQVNTNGIYQDITVLENLISLFQLEGKEEINLNELYEETRLVDLLAELAGKRQSPPFTVESPGEVMFRPEMVEFKSNKDRLRQMEDEKNYEAVINLLLADINQIPFYAAKYVDLSIYLLEVKQPAAAWQAISQARHLAHNSYSILKGMTHYFLWVNNFEMAEKTCKMLLEIAPHELIILGYLTESLLGQKRNEEALKIGVPLIEVSSLVGEMPAGMIIYLIKEMSHYLVEQKQDYRMAIHLWEMGMKVDPANVTPVIELAKVLLGQGDQQRARLLLVEAQRFYQYNNEINILLQQVSVPLQPVNAKKHRKKH
jgi:tetratricopeptide (TPR) repeat protein